MELRLLVLIDEYTRELRVARWLGSQEVIETLAEVMLCRGIPEYIRSDNGPEFVAQELRTWFGNLGTGTLYIEPGSPWENGYCESFNGSCGTSVRDPGERQLSIRRVRMRFPSVILYRFLKQNPNEF